MDARPVRLKVLLLQRHLQTYGTFCREYDKAARAIDADLVGTAPSRAQFYRWQSGELEGLPYADHCQVLEKIFPGWTAAQLFECCDSSNGAQSDLPGETRHVFDLIETGLSDLSLPPAEWGVPDGGCAPPSSQPEIDGYMVPAMVSGPAVRALDNATKELGQRLLAFGAKPLGRPCDDRRYGAVAGLGYAR